MQFHEDYERRIQDLERRVQALENIIKGSDKNKPGRAPILSADAKSEVIHKHNAGKPYSTLAKEYGVSKSTIFNICHSYKEKGKHIIPVQRG